MKLSESSGVEKGPSVAEPDKILRGAFEEYLKDAPEPFDSRIDYNFSGTRNYFVRRAKSCLNGVRATPEEAHGLLLSRELKGGEKEIAGFFLSEVYNKSDVKEIVYNLEVEVWHLADSLSNLKTFINYGNGGHRSGTCSKGIIVNHIRNKDRATITSGLFSSGLIITCGGEAETGYYNGDDEWVETGQPLKVSITDCVQISGLFQDSSIDKYAVPFFPDNMTERIKYFHRGEVQELSEYIDNLVEKINHGRINHDIVVEAFRNLGIEPYEKIKQDLRGILRRAGKDV